MYKNAGTGKGSGISFEFPVSQNSPGEADASLERIFINDFCG